MRRSLRSVALVSVLLALALPAALQAQPAKRPLNHRDFDGWRSIASQTLSRDGRTLAYSFMPQDADGELIVARPEDRPGASRGGRHATATTDPEPRGDQPRGAAAAALRRRHDQKDYTLRMQQFFDHFLKGAAKPEWMERGIPFVEREEEKERFRKLVDR